jgi:8-amino-7-oxononanoate synthase
MTSHIPWLAGGLHQLEEQKLLRRRRQVIPLPDAWCEIDGRRLRNFSSNDYLNLAHDARLIQAAKAAIETHGIGSRSSALVTGRTDWHVQLEERLAAFEGEDAAILFPTGYAANLGTIAALVGKDDVIFAERLNHASLIDGSRLSKAAIRVYEHNDLDHLNRELGQAKAYRKRWIITDSLFSMDGDVALLAELCTIAENHDAALLIDEAHATGIFGENGRGVAEWKHVENRIAVRIGTLSKAVGTMGGFVAGSHQLINWLWNRARPQFFSTALPPAVCAAACTSIEIIQSEPQRRERLLSLSDLFRRKIRNAGFETVENSVGPIVPIIFHEPEKAVSAASRLEAQGLLVAGIRYPTVPQGTSRLRITLSCAHSEEDIEKLIRALGDVLNPEIVSK